MKFGPYTLVVEHEALFAASSIRLLLCIDPTDPNQETIWLQREALWEIAAAYALDTLSL